ncbi:MAG: hypothetical protein WC663_02755 [Patescibacteria group bacterium]|jgi:hypothetical protein
MYKIKIKTKILITLALLFIPIFSIKAAYFNPDNILTDEEYTNSKSLTTSAIQRFLIKKGSELAVLQYNGKSVAKIFHDSAVKYGINPKLLIATAQKEQSTITDSSLSDYQKKYLMGYAVFDRFNPIQYKYQGIPKQIDSAAWQFRQYIDNPSYYGYQKGLTKTTSDGYTVTPKNNATAGLYNYTPHAGLGKGATVDDSGNGNFLFWQIWTNWFANYYPNGTLLKIEGDDTLYVLQGEKKKPFLSDRIITTSKYKDTQAVVLSADQDKYLTGKPTIFPDGTLLYDQNNNYFIISHKKIRRFQSLDVMKKLGYHKTNAQFIDQKGKDYYEKDLRIKEDVVFPIDGTVIYEKTSNIKYLLENSQKRPIISDKIYNNQFDSRNLVAVSKATLNKLETGSPILFRDGTLIKDGASNLYVIEYGKKRPISKTTFEKMGYKYENVILTQYKLRKLHETGKKVKI